MKLRKVFYGVVWVVSSLFFSGIVNADVSDDDFKVQTTRNLINLCTASENDPHAAQAIHFCHGYLVGAYHYYESIVKDNTADSLFCLPDPKPTRTEGINMFVAWALNHPQYMNETPVDTEFRFLADKFPCKKK